jgi:hypothetical protein
MYFFHKKDNFLILRKAINEDAHVEVMVYNDLKLRDEETKRSGYTQKRYYYPVPTRDYLIKYEIGDMICVLKGMNNFKNTIAKKKYQLNPVIPYKWYKVRRNCIKAILTCLLCLKEHKIYRDVRGIIFGYIWSSRNDSIWLIE